MLCVAQLVDVVVCSVPGMLKLTWSRGDFADGVNRVAVALTRPDGSVLEHPACDPNHRAFLRSAAKPAQAVGAVRAGTLERFGLDDRHRPGGVTVGGAERQVTQVAAFHNRLLFRLGHAVTEYQCRNQQCRNEDQPLSTTLKQNHSNTSQIEIS